MFVKRTHVCAVALNLIFRANQRHHGQATRERITQIANIYFPVAALKKGILDISADNRADFVRGVIDGYFPQ